MDNNLSEDGNLQRRRVKKKLSRQFSTLDKNNVYHLFKRQETLFTIAHNNSSKIGQSHHEFHQLLKEYGINLVSKTAFKAEEKANLGKNNKKIDSQKLQRIQQDVREEHYKKKLIVNIDKLEQLLTF